MIRNQKIIFMLFCSFFALNANQDLVTDSQESAKSQISKPEVFDALLHRILKQLDAIDLAIEEVSQAINTNSIKVDDKKAVREHIKNIRTFISDVKNGKIFKFDEKNLELLLQINRFLLSHLDHALIKKFSKIEPFEAEAFIKKTQDAVGQTYTDSNVHLLMNQNEKKLYSVILRNREYGLSSFNKFFRNLEIAYRESGVKSLTDRLTPYVFLTAYLTYITPKDALPDFLDDLKDWMGGNPDKGSEQRKMDVYTKPVPPANNNVQNNQTANNNPQANTRTAAYNIPAYKPNDGVLGGLHYYIARIAELDLKPIITIPVAAYFTPIVTKDMKDLWTWSQEKTKQFSCYLKNESYEAPAVVKASKLTFSDIVGYDHVKMQLTCVPNYFYKKNVFDRIGANVDRGFLFVGPLDLGKNFVYALAGEITNQLKLVGKPACGVYEVHSSNLIKKDIDEMIKEIEAEVTDPNTPTILFIEDINWLCDHAKGDPKIWSSLVNAMNKNLSGTKKQICIVATAQDCQTVHAALKSQGRLGYLVQFGNPTIDERKAFLIKELNNRGMRVQEFDVDKLALNTENCTYGTLSSVMKSASMLARSKQQMLAQNHIEECIDSIVHSIISENKPVTKSHALKQQSVLAAHYSGQAIAHLLLQPQNEQLIKVTLLPVGNVNVTRGIKLGSLITHSEDNANEFATKEDLRKNCVIKLAGIESQRKLHSEPTASLVNEVKKQVNVIAKQIVFAGDDEKNLPKDIKQNKLKEIYFLIEQCTAEAANLVAKNLANIEKVAKLLQSKQTMTAEEIKALI